MQEILLFRVIVKENIGLWNIVIVTDMKMATG